MKQSTDVRVRTDARYDQLYKDLRPVLVYTSQGKATIARRSPI